MQGYQINSEILSTSFPYENSIIKSFNKPLVFYQFQSNIQHNIHQDSVILSISEHYISQHSTSLWYSINFRSIHNPTNPYYSQCIPPKTHNPDPQPPSQHSILTLTTPSNPLTRTSKLLTKTFTLCPSNSWTKILLLYLQNW